MLRGVPVQLVYVHAGLSAGRLLGILKVLTFLPPSQAFGDFEGFDLLAFFAGLLDFGLYCGTNFKGSTFYHYIDDLRSLSCKFGRICKINPEGSTFMPIFVVPSGFFCLIMPKPAKICENMPFCGTLRINLAVCAKRMSASFTLRRYTLGVFYLKQPQNHIIFKKIAKKPLNHAVF
ncbi:MAG: hypothetical protein K6G06_04265 [Butyrivibrio sp.]|nr:hypothetical protein [Butyrivibrio sp.]